MNKEEILLLLEQAHEANKETKYAEAERIAGIVLSATNEDDVNHSEALLVIVSALGRKGKLEEAVTFGESLLEIANRYSHQSVITRTLHALGSVYFSLASHTKALEYFEKAMTGYEESDDIAGIGSVYGNIANVYSIMGLFDNALVYYQKSLLILEEIGAESSLARQLNNIAGVYMNMNSYEIALEYYTKSLHLREKLGEVHGIAIVYGNIGGVYGAMDLLHESAEYLNKSLTMHKELDNTYDIAFVMMTLGSTYKKLGEYETALEIYLQSLSIQNQLQDVFLLASSLGDIARLYSESDSGLFDAMKAEEYFHKAIAVSIEIEAKFILYKLYKALAYLYKMQNRWEEFGRYFEKYHELEKEVQNEDAKKSAEKLAYERRETEREKYRAIERARAQATDEILANILPPVITERLIKGEKKIADFHDSVSVLFVDIVGFTKLSEKLPAGELIDLLDIVFTRFDTICKKHGLEKIKTIGDAYMAVCGAPIPFDNHAERTALAALEMLEDFVIGQQFSVQIDLGFRIGLHSGNVVAGIIGENKYSYDLWGDAVNTASRMESHGEEDKIHVSEEFKKSSGGGFRFYERGEMDIKGKGMMKTYFLEKYQNEV